MKLTEDEIQMLLKDKKFCRNKDAYCLGNTFEEAAEVCILLMQMKEEEEALE